MAFWRTFFSPEEMWTDGVLDAILWEVYPAQPRDHITETYYFRLTEHRRRREIGYVALREGEGGLMYYAGHIGYRIEPPYRGHGYALRACRLLAPVFREMGHYDLVLTCDPDNAASRRTIEHLRVVRERQVAVPEKIARLLDQSREKLRYLWDVSAEADREGQV